MKKEGEPCGLQDAGSHGKVRETVKVEVGHSLETKRQKVTQSNVLLGSTSRRSYRSNGLLGDNPKYVTMETPRFLEVVNPGVSADSFHHF